MKNSHVLDEIEYTYIISLTKFFLTKLSFGEVRDLDMLITNVKSKSKVVMSMAYTFDETIWPPDHPEYYKDLVAFKVQLHGRVEYLPFKLFISKGFYQDTIFIL